MISVKSGESVVESAYEFVGAAVEAALAAEGVSQIDDIEYIQRGYEDFEGKLAMLGAVIEKVDSEREAQKAKLKIS